VISEQEIWRICTWQRWCGRTAESSNIEVKEVILRKVADIAGDETDIYDYLVTRIPI